MKRLAIIPARGGSKRIPGKNIKPFLGKPIIAYSIQAAIESEMFDTVMVSTDSEKIKEVALEYNAQVPFIRSEENANDFATTYDVIAEVVDQFEKEGQFFDEVVCLYPTAPFVTADVLKKAIVNFESNNFDSYFPVIRFGFPIQRSLKIVNDSGKMALTMPEYELSRSQDLDPCFHDAGQFYVLKVSEMKIQKKLWMENTGVFEIEELDGHDIDNPIDWKLAELKFQLKSEL